MCVGHTNRFGKECWVLTRLEGHMAASTDRYKFVPDKFSTPMVLCFNDDNTGTVTGDDTKFVKFGASTLVGWATNQGIELIETYQIDRVMERFFSQRAELERRLFFQTDQM